ncbi:MAG TPA: sigma-70 family RNA polymerase sigma factor [Candidatus Polarisedimenticolia bacterium]|jgi:RNA polymerase sigma factor (TIGR02999 family)|nr:sigma-70 family RNA polymerase sigma factor [Candidatus Polarisedimenticolia bacterium]
MDSAGKITQRLAALKRGDEDAFNELFSLVYRDLRAIAHRALKRGRPDQTLKTTALVHEAYLRLVDQSRADWQDRGHFFSVAATAMRHILIDYARNRHAKKRGGGAIPIELDEPLLRVEARGEELIALDAAITRLSEMSPRLGRVVELRFFGGLSVEETAEVLELAPRTVKRDWRIAKAFLYQNMTEGPSVP